MRKYIYAALIFLGIFSLSQLVYTFLKEREEARLEVIASQQQAKMHQKPQVLVPLPLLDIDKMVSRFKVKHELFEKIRVASLAANQKLSPTPQKYDEQARMAVVLADYITVYGDFYSESLEDKAAAFANIAISQGCHDPWVKIISLTPIYNHRLSSNDADAQALIDLANKVAESAYPEKHKYSACRLAIQNLEKVKEDNESENKKNKEKKAPLKSCAKIPELCHTALDLYRELVKDKMMTDDRLFYSAEKLLDIAREDEPMLRTLGEGFDKIFADEAPQHLVRQLLQGSFFVRAC